MNKNLHARLTVVLDLETDRALRRISAITNQTVSSIVREIISEPAKVVASALDAALDAPDPASRKAILNQLEMFVEGSYGDYLKASGELHG